jgi:heat shock protein HslJ
VRIGLVSVVSLAVLALASACGGSDDGGGTTASFEEQPWVLASGVDLPQDVSVSRPSATFADGTVGGTTGCNRYTAGYTVDGDSLELDEVAATLMGCPPPADAIERAYLAALEQVAGWRLEGEELVLVDGDDGELLRFEAATPVGEWEATGVLSGDAFASLVAGTTITARFNENGTISGSGGCNTYTSSFTTDGGAIRITKPAATRKACPSPAGVMEQEAAFFAALPAAESYRMGGSSLELLSPDGTFVATFVRSS